MHFWDGRSFILYRRRLDVHEEFGRATLRHKHSASLEYQTCSVRFEFSFILATSAFSIVSFAIPLLKMPDSNTPQPSQRGCHPPIFCSRYSHTFENRSSLPPNPPAGFLVCVDVFAPGVTGTALLHPPKSSSSLIFGGLLAAKLLTLPRPLFVLVAELPQPKSVFVADVVGGDLTTVESGSGVVHTSLDPQGSIPVRLESAGAGCCGLLVCCDGA